MDNGILASYYIFYFRFPCFQDKEGWTFVSEVVTIIVFSSKKKKDASD